MLNLLSKLRSNLVLYKYKRRGVIIGENVFISHKAYIDSHPGSQVFIGNNVYITRNVVILNHTDTHKGGPLNLWVKYGGARISKDIIIGDNAFIGVNSVVMPGVKIGKNAIVGALSLVTNDVPDGMIYAGIPAKQIGMVGDMIKRDLPNFDVKSWKRDNF